MTWSIPIWFHFCWVPLTSYNLMSIVLNFGKFLYMIFLTKVSSKIAFLFFRDLIDSYIVSLEFLLWCIIQFFLAFFPHPLLFFSSFILWHLDLFLSCCYLQHRVSTEVLPYSSFCLQLSYLILYLCFVFYLNHGLFEQFKHPYHGVTKVPELVRTSSVFTHWTIICHLHWIDRVSAVFKVNLCS